MATEAPLTRDRILTAAEDVIRRFGPAKATVVDVARALDVTHASVYRHFASKAELREAVVALWLERIMPPLAAVADARGRAPARLRRWIDTLVAAKRKRSAGDPELFAAYFALASETNGLARSHLQELVDQAAQIITAGVDAGDFHVDDPAAAARSILLATSRFHHPSHAAEWNEPNIDADLDEVWQLLLKGLRATPVLARKKRK